MKNIRKRTLWIIMTMALLVLLSACSPKEKTAPKPEARGAEGSEELAERFSPLIEEFEWGSSMAECGESYGFSDSEQFQAEGYLTIPLAMTVDIYDHDMTAWLKFEQENNFGLYELTLKFDPEEYTAIRDCMIRDFGDYQLEGNPEQSVFFESGKISGYYTEEELRSLYGKMYSEEELTAELMKELLDSSEISFAVRSSGQITMSARNYMTMKVLRDKK